MKYNNARLEVASKKAMDYSKMSNLSAVQSEYVVELVLILLNLSIIWINFNLT